MPPLPGWQGHVFHLSQNYPAAENILAKATNLRTLHKLIDDLAKRMA